MTEREALRALARAWGVQTAYRDIDRRRRVAGDEALLAVLRALGVSLRGPRDAATRLADRTAALDARTVEPVVVAWNGRLPVFSLRLRRSVRRVRCHLAGDDGSTRTWDFRADTLRDAGPAPAGARRVHVTLPGRVPLGVHRLAIEGAGREGQLHVVSAPRHAWSSPDGDRAWGVFAPLYGLRSRKSLGVGDLGDLGRLADWVGECGGSVVGTLPLLATFLDEPFEPSPYAPVSRLFWNELYVDVTAAPEIEDAPEARRLLASDAVRRQLARLGRGRLVDHREAMRLKRRVLEALAGAPARSERQAAFDEFLGADPQVRDYARYRAAVEATRTTWPAWTGAARAGRLAERDLDPARVRYHCWVQWMIDAQLRAVGDAGRAHPVGLYLDLPVGVHGGGYDTWRERDAFAPGVDAGAPPDPFFSGGQSWGFPPLHPHHIRDDGYRYPIAYLRRHMQVARVLRLDHVMGLHRLYWVPHGFDATEGVYVRYQAEEMHALVSLESHRHRCEVVGENLGTVPAAVNAAMARHRLLRMHVLQYEVDPARSPALAPAPADSLACLNTHDMHPFAGWWAARDVDDGESRGFIDRAAAARERRRRKAMRRALVDLLRRTGDLAPGAGATRAVLGASLRFLARGPARILLVTLEDLWLEERPQNVPGTAGSGNWRRRLRYGIERITRDGALRAALTAIAAARRLRRSRQDGK